MKLADLHPELQGLILSFDCPAHPEHRIRISLRPKGPSWDYSGELFDTLTLTPSINHVGCWHGFVTNGEIVTVNDSPPPAAVERVLREEGVPTEAPAPQETGLIRPPEPHIIRPDARMDLRHVVQPEPRSQP